MSSFDYNEAFKRNLGLLTELEQTVLRRSTIAIPGLGGVGGVHLTTLLRLGIGGFHLADADTFSLANFNRQAGANINTIGRSKVETMAEVARCINPEVRLKTWNCFIDEGNVEEFLRGADVVIDSVDAFAIDARRLIFTKAHQMNIPVVTCGPIGFGVAMTIFLPRGLSFDDYFGFEPGLSEQEKFIRFMVGLCPRPHFLRYMDTGKLSADERSGPSISSSVTLCAGFAATETVKLLTGRGRVDAIPYVHYFDPYLLKFIRIRQCGWVWRIVRKLGWKRARKLLNAKSTPGRPLSSSR